jgi:hypothetical protein
MSEELNNLELRKDDENDVEGHRKRAANDEPRDEAEADDEVEAHRFRKDHHRKD